MSIENLPRRLQQLTPSFKPPPDQAGWPLFTWQNISKPVIWGVKIIRMVLWLKLISEQIKRLTSNKSAIGDQMLRRRENITFESNALRCGIRIRVMSSIWLYIELQNASSNKMFIKAQFGGEKLSFCKTCPMNEETCAVRSRVSPSIFAWMKVVLWTDRASSTLQIIFKVQGNRTVLICCCWNYKCHSFFFSTKLCAGFFNLFYL